MSNATEELPPTTVLLTVVGVIFGLFLIFQCLILAMVVKDCEQRGVFYAGNKVFECKEKQMTKQYRCGAQSFYHRTFKRSF